MVSTSQTTTKSAPGREAKAAMEPGSQDGRQAQRIVLTLSASQVGQVMRTVSRSSDGADPVDAEHLVGIDEPLYRELVSDRRLSRSLLSGLMILRCFQEDDELGIAELSRRLDMRTSTTHRYVSTLLAAGLLERDPVSRLYRRVQP